METPAPTRHTIRELMAQELKAAFEAAPTVPGDISWGLVKRSILTKSDLADNAYCLGIYDTTERVENGVGWERRYVKFILEFHVKTMEGDEPATFLNHALGCVVQRVAAAGTLGGRALDVNQTGAELDIEGAFDKYVSGVVVFDVSYRCRPNDPYTRV